MATNAQKVKSVSPKGKSSTAKNISTPTTIFLSQTVAKSKFLSHCRYAINNKKNFVCIKDHSNNAFLTLTASEERGGVVTVSAQFFKDNFSRCTSLIRDGVVFRLTLKYCDEVVYARRHRFYKDPVDGVIDQWRENIVKEALAKARKNAISQLAREIAAHNDVTLEKIEALAHGIARMAIGHRPFEEGELPNRRGPDPMH